MNIENCKKWSEALKSGKYKQCTNTLHKATGGHCCLGVVDLIAFDTETFDYFQIESWLGITPSESDEYVRLNDKERKSFVEIAAIIDAKIEALS